MRKKKIRKKRPHRSEIPFNEKKNRPAETALSRKPIRLVVQSQSNGLTMSVSVVIYNVNLYANLLGTMMTRAMGGVHQTTNS